MNTRQLTRNSFANFDIWGTPHITELKVECVAALLPPLDRFTFVVKKIEAPMRASPVKNDADEHEQSRLHPHSFMRDSL
jgi:hypothetical protein